MQNVSPFWNAAVVGEESEVDECVVLQYRKQAFAVALQVNAKNPPKKMLEKDERFKHIGTGVSKTIITLPYLTNPIEVKIGQTLRAPTGEVVIHVRCRLSWPGLTTDD